MVFYIFLLLVIGEFPGNFSHFSFSADWLVWGALSFRES